MKGFFRWFKSGAKMKRWILIILLGVTLCCYGMMKILTGKELEFIELSKIIAIFVIGFVLLIVGIISIQKRNQFMVDNSSMIIGVYSSSDKRSGTMQTINMAKKAKMKLQLINLDDNPIFYLTDK